MQATASQQQRLPELDVLRGIAACMVVLFHYTVRYDQLYGYRELPAIRMELGYLGVEFFFCISGFVILMTLEKTRRPLDFVVSRVSRLWPAYIAAIMLTYAAERVFGLPGREATAIEAVVNLTMIQELLHVNDVDAVYWSLQVELIFYAWMLVAFTLGLLPKMRMLIAACLVPTIVYFVAERFFGKQLSYLAGTLMIVHHIPYFAIGIAAYNIKSKKDHPGADVLLMVFAVAIAAVCLSSTDGLIAGLSAVLLYAVAQGRLFWLSQAPLRFLGMISYTLYLIHQNIGYIIIHHALALGVSTDGSMLAAITVSLLLATAITFAIERPARDWIRKEYRRRFPPALVDSKAGA